MNVVDIAPTRRTDLAEFLGDVERLEEIFATWEETPRGVGRGLPACHRGASRRGADAAGAGAEIRSRGARRDEGRDRRRGRLRGAPPPRHHQGKPRRARRARARERAADARVPRRRRRAGDRWRRPSIEVRFLGACNGCPASTLTFHAGVKKAVEDACAEITEVVQAKGIGGGESGVNFVSPFALHAKGDWLAGRHLVRDSRRRHQGDDHRRREGDPLPPRQRRHLLPECLRPSRLRPR